MSIKIDASELATLGRALETLPSRYMKQALQRSLHRSKTAVMRRYARVAAKRLKLSQKMILAAVHMGDNAEGITLRVRSDHVALTKIGARQNRRGSFVPRRQNPLIERAFIARMKTGHRGIFRRVPGETTATGQGRFKEFFGPNPAGDVNRNPDDWSAEMRNAFDEAYMIELEKQIVQALNRLPSGHR